MAWQGRRRHKGAAQSRPWGRGRPCGSSACLLCHGRDSHRTCGGLCSSAIDMPRPRHTQKCAKSLISRGLLQTKERCRADIPDEAVTSRPAVRING